MSCFVYALKLDDAFKIGVTWDLQSRLTCIRGSNPYPDKLFFAHILKFSAEFRGRLSKSANERARLFERRLHEMLQADWLSGEWFRVDEHRLKVLMKAEASELKGVEEYVFTPKPTRINVGVKHARRLIEMRNNLTRVKRPTNKEKKHVSTTRLHRCTGSDYSGSL